jgi:glycosyltransferase involved in cell wall biosynthesis
VNPELYVAKYGREDIFHRALLFLERMTFYCADVVLATNESYKQIAIKRGEKAPEDVFVVRNGPDLDELKVLAPNPKLKHGKSYLVGYVGVMAIQDGLDILVDVAEYIKRSGRTDIHFTCIGGGPAFQQLLEMVDEKNLRDIVNFTGRIAENEKVEILSTADICVNPDRPCEMNDLSTMIKIMEYMACGKPIVQFDLKEGKISAGEASLYCDKENQVADFANKICWLADHPEERKKMGEFGRRRVEKELAWKYSVANLLEAYDRALRRRHQDSEAVIAADRDLNEMGQSKAISETGGRVARPH